MDKKQYNRNLSYYLYDFPTTCYDDENIAKTK